MTQGPNVKKLIAHKMSIDAIPNGGGLGDGLKFLMDKQRIIAGAKAATEWVNQAISVVKTAPDNPWGDDDEAIAGEILRQVKERALRPTVE